MALRVDLTVGPGNLAVGVDQKRDTFGVSLVRTVGSTVGHAERSIRVGQKHKRKRELFDKRLIVLDRVKADAEDYGIGLLKLMDSITESLAFDRSTGSVGLGVEPK